MTDFVREPIASESVDSLAMDCLNFANSNEAFASFRGHSYGRDILLADSATGLNWKSGFFTTHMFDEGVYHGDSFTLSLCCIASGEVLPSQVKELAQAQMVDFPEGEKVNAVDVNFSATYTINRFANLGWNVRRIYDIHFDVTEEDDDFPGEEIEVVSLDDEMAFRPAATSEEEAQKQQADPFASFQEAAYLESARKILDAVQQEDIPQIDITTMFPNEIVAAIENED